MNIKILHSWLKDYIKTDATAKEIAKALSLSSVSVERVEPHNADFILDAEITTNRPDLMSVLGLARETVAILNASGREAKFIKPNYKTSKEEVLNPYPLTIKGNDSLIRRICAVVMEVEVKPSPSKIKERLETSDIRSLNNLIDITNYVMRVIGHPTHVFDYDKLKTQTLVVRESRKNEKIVTLDGKEHTLKGGDIVADDGLGNIVDLLGVMGLKNSVVTDNTKRIIFFINNNDPYKIRQTSMNLEIRTEAAQINEKNIDPELAMAALLFGIELYKKYADGKVRSKIVDIYPHPPHKKSVKISKQKIQQVIGVELPLKQAANILENLDFEVSTEGDSLTAIPPSTRLNDIAIPEDLAEEVARIYGYHNLPNVLPPFTTSAITSLEDNHFYWEKRAKEAFKYWGLTEVYTYPMVSEQLYEGPTSQAVTLKNPLGEDFIFMRRTLVPSLLQIIKENKNEEATFIFEIANVYERAGVKLPTQTQKLAGVMKGQHVTFFIVKGIIEQLCTDFGINTLNFKPLGKGGLESEVFIGKELIGEIEILDEGFINFELNFDIIISNATTQKSYTPENKFPPIIEDLSFTVSETIATGELLQFIKKQSPLIQDVSLLDKYVNSRTFHVIYQDRTKNLTVSDAQTIREKIIMEMKKHYKAEPK